MDELDKKLHVSRFTIWRDEKDKTTPSRATLQKIAKILKIKTFNIIYNE